MWDRDVDVVDGISPMLLCETPLINLVPSENNISSLLSPLRFFSSLHTPTQIFSKASRKMTIVGVSLKPVPADSHIFIKCEGKLGLDFVKLYELAYCKTIPRKLSGPEWSGVRYFHGTGHCGYVDRYASRALGHKITTSSWCSTRTCAVRGILRHGYLMRFCLRGTAIFTDVSSRVDMMSYNSHAFHLEGHFISSSGQIASGYAQALMVKAALQHRAIFVCKIRHRHLNISGRRYVRRDRVCACELHGMPFKIT